MVSARPGGSQWQGDWRSAIPTTRDFTAEVAENAENGITTVGRRQPRLVVMKEPQVVISAASASSAVKPLRLDMAGTYTLVATAAGATDAPASAAFVIDPAAAETLAFTDEPASAASNQPLGTVQVTLYDEFSNIATNDSSTAVTVTETGGSATLLGTPSQTAVNGVATFSDLSITEVAANYTLDADSGAMTTATSATFDIIPDLVITTQPAASTVAGADITVVVEIREGGTAMGGDVTPVTLSIASGTGDPTATLTGGGPTAATDGVVTFTLTVDKVGTDYALDATALGLMTAVSNAFAITPAGAESVQFTVEPTDTVAGAVIAPAIEVTAYDAFGNVDTNFDGGGNTVTLTIASGTGDATATLTGGGAAVATAGVATFAGVSIDKIAAGYTLDATGAGVANGGTSAAFAITAAPAAIITLDLNGSPRVFSDGPNGSYDTAMGETEVVGWIPADGSTIVITFPGTATGTFTSAAGSGGSILWMDASGFYRADDSTAGTSYTITVTAYGAVGGLIEGTFSGTVKDLFGSTTKTITNGIFTVIRWSDT